MRTLSPDELTLTIPAEQLKFVDTSELPEVEPTWIGQQRAEKAARFGLALDQPDYNLLVLGEVGCGRSSLSFRVMQEAGAKRTSVPDLVYLFNFDHPVRPVAIRLKTGQGSVLHQLMVDFARTIATDIAHRLGEEGFRLDCERLRKDCKIRTDHAYAELAAVAAGWHYALHREEGRILFSLLDKNGQAMHEDVLLAMPPDRRMVLEQAEQELRNEITKYLEKVRPWEYETEVLLATMRRDAVKPLLDTAVGHMRTVLADQGEDAAKFENWLASLQRDVLEAVELFVPEPGGEADSEKIASLLTRYQVNLVVDNRDATGLPVLRDDDPTFRSLFGIIDYQVENGVLVTDFTRIRAGNLLRAHGGFLMLHLRDVIRDAQVWEKLWRFLRSGRLQIEEPSATSSQVAMATLEPEAVDVRVKVVLVATREEYYGLQEIDPEFARHFRVKVDFAESFLTGEQTRRASAEFIAHTCRRLDLPHFEAEAVALLLIEMQRKVDDKRRQSASFGRLEALVAESAAFCQARQGSVGGAVDVQSAMTERIARHDYPEQRMHEAIAEGEVMIRVHGREVGQINGLTQIDLGDYRFGSPVCISARVYAGDDGVLNINREVEMTGPHHDKGIFILESWLAASFSHLAPLCLSASLVFEQEYHGLEGDSASCAELYALLSALSGLPLPQGIAVTGALNQHGEVLPVGGINEKIEGYFRVCQRIGLDGTQGVVIPTTNLPHLLLDRQVVEAVAAGQFKVQAIDNVLEGIELLTGVFAGTLDAVVGYRHDSVLGRVQQTLEHFRKACEEVGHRDKDHG